MELQTLGNASGMAVAVAGYGGRVVSVRVPDRDGRLEDVTLGYDTLGDYREDTAYMGALVGRFANRIAGGRFSLDGRPYALPANDPPNHLHGGPEGFHTVVWDGERVDSDEGEALALSHTSPAGAGGYPGRLDVRATLTVTPASELVVDYRAATTEPTVVNLTQHSYWNLAGHGRGDVLDHLLTLHASRFTPVDGDQIPTGELWPVDGTPFDFRAPTPVGARIADRDPQLGIGGGYDHNWVLDGLVGELSPAARLHDPGSGRVLEVLTTEPGLQVYTGNAFAGIAGKDGATYRAHAGVALEAQHFPDSPNQPSFPSTALRPGEEYRSRTVYRFSVAAE